MFKNYIKIALRNIIKQKGFTFINILGLTTGITASILMILFVFNELSYDKFNTKADRIYRLYVHSIFNGIESNNSKTPGLLAPYLKKDFPEVENYTRLGYFGRKEFIYNNEVYKSSRVYYVDSTFFDVFDYKLLVGDKKNVLNKPNQIVLSETTARNIFGKESPVGKVLTSNDEQRFYTVVGVMADMPGNSHFKCPMLASMCTYPKVDEQIWLQLLYTSYVVLKNGVDPIAFEKKMRMAGLKYIAPQVQELTKIDIFNFVNSGNVYEHKMQPLKDIYLFSIEKYNLDANTEWGDVEIGDINYVYILSGIVLFIIIIAIINFMNLSTARSEKRSKEVGIRKVLGSTRVNIILQFLFESVLLTLVSTVIAVIGAYLILPYLNTFLNKNIEFHLLNNPYTIPLILILVIMLGIISGSYPAFYLSAFTPNHSLKGSAKSGTRKNRLRNTLVVFQFAISIFLIAGTMIIEKQLAYMQTKNLGFNKDYLITINNAGKLNEKYNFLKEELLTNTNIVNVCNSQYFFASGVPGNGYFFDKIISDEPLSFSYLNVDTDFLKTYQLKMVEGRFFDDTFGTDTSSVIVNEAAVNEFHLADPVGKNLTKLGTNRDGKTYKIIGVIKNFNWESLHNDIRPLALHLRAWNKTSNTLVVRIKNKNIPSTIKFIENKWLKYSNNDKMDFAFLSESINELYKNEEKTGLLAAGFSTFAIIIACLGLFSLAAYSTEQRTKEIGVRKVMGASISQVIMIVSKEFLKWVITANIIAIPLIYYVMNKWLQKFAYRIEIDYSVYLISGGIAILIALLTVGFNSYKAAIANPVKSLKYE